MGTPPMGFETPNLDGVDTDDLKELEKTYADLQLYCRYKRTAMERRAGGMIESASRYETICEKIYGNLPEWARW